MSSTKAAKSIEEFRQLSNSILGCELHGRQRAEFLREVTSILLDFSGADAIEIQLHEGSTFFRCEARTGDASGFHFESEAWWRRMARADSFVWPADRICLSLFNRDVPANSAFFTEKGSFWTGDPDSHFEESEWTSVRADYSSMGIIPLDVGNDRTGLVLLKSRSRDFFTLEDIQRYEDTAQTLAIALAHRRSNALLRERVKELTCLYGIARVSARSDQPLPGILVDAARLLPPAWLYPEIASCRIIFDGREYATPGFQTGVQKQSAEIVTQGKPRGSVEVH